ncbi:MAG: hypothetical protein AAB647_03895, partial [Patescibacteria group bacterium]
MSKTAAYRFLEILPALITWSILLGLTVFSIKSPVITAALVLVYAIYWFANSILMSIHLIMGFRTYRREIRTNWLTKLDETKTTRHRWPDIYHLVIIANSKETWPILEATVEALKASTYPLERILVVLATEARCGEVGVTNGERLKQQYGQTFGGVFVTVHPADLPDEIIGKGANISYSAE